MKSLEQVSSMIRAAQKLGAGHATLKPLLQYWYALKEYDSIRRVGNRTDVKRSYRRLKRRERKLGGTL